MSKNIADAEELSARALKVLAEVTKGWPMKGQYERLEEMSGVKKRKWETLRNGITQPTVETLLALASIRGEFAAYLLLGDQFPRQEQMVVTRVPAVISVDEEGNEFLISDFIKLLKKKSSN